MSSTTHIFLHSQKAYKKDLETEIKGKGMQVGTDTPEMQRVKKASEIASQVCLTKSDFVYFIIFY